MAKILSVEEALASMSANLIGIKIIKNLNMIINLDNLSRNKAFAVRNFYQQKKERENVEKSIMNQMRRSKSINFIYSLSETSLIHDETMNNIIFKQNKKKSFHNIFKGRNYFPDNIPLSYSRSSYILLTDYSSFENSDLFDLNGIEKEYRDLYHDFIKDKVKSLDDFSIK